MENLKELRQLRAQAEVRADELLEEGKLEEGKNELEQIKDLDARIKAVEEEIKKLKEEGSDKEDDKEKEVVVKEEERSNKQEGETRMSNKFNPGVNENKESAEVRGFLNYVSSKGSEKRDVTSVEADVLIPQEIINKAEMLPETVVDLKEFTQVQKVNTAQGTRPILNSTEDIMSTVAELQANPSLSDPEFRSVAYKVLTRRGQIAVSSESLADSQEDLGNLIANHIQRQSLNTTNKSIADVMKTFTPKSVSNLDDIKKIINVDIDNAYELVFVVTASMFQVLDTMKDGNGIYLVQPDVTAASGRSIFGRPISIVKDTMLGVAGDCKMFVGDKNAISFFDRNAVAVRWIDHPHYGEILATSIRYDVQKVMDEGGVFVTYTAPAETPVEGA